MKKTAVTLLAFMVLLTGLAVDSAAKSNSPRYTQANLTGTWHGKRAGRLYTKVTFTSTGKVAKWVAGGRTISDPLIGRLSVAADGKVTGVLKRTYAEDGSKMVYTTITFNMRFESRTKLTGAATLVQVTKDRATGRVLSNAEQVRPHSWYRPALKPAKRAR